MSVGPFMLKMTEKIFVNNKHITLKHGDRHV